MLMSIGSSGTSIYMGCLLAYRNTPHEATGKKPSYLLYGRDCHYPIEAAFLPANEVEGADLTGYRQEILDNPESPEALQKVL